MMTTAHDEPHSWKAGIGRFYAPYLGLGAVFGAVFIMLMLASPFDDASGSRGTGRAFLLCFLACDSIVNFALAFAQKRFGRTVGPKTALAGGISMAVGFGCAGLAFAGFLDPQAAAVVSGVLAGVGNAPFVIMWGKIYGSCSRNETITYASLSFGIAAIAKYALSMLALRPVVLFAAMAALLALAVACQILCLKRVERSPIFNLPQSGRPSSPKLAVSLLWPVFAGVAICSFIGGLTWGAAASGTGLGVSLASCAATMAVSGIGVASIFAFGGYFSFDNLPRIVLPIAVGTLIVLPFLEDASQGALDTVFAVLYSAVVLFFDVGAWTLLALCCERANMAAERVFGIGRGLQALIMGLGIAAYGILGPTERVFCLVVSTVYLVALCMASSPRKAGFDAIGAQCERRESAYDCACAALSEECGLSPREADVLVHLGRGHSSTYIGKELFLSNETIKTHVKHIYRKLGVESREELIDIVMRKEQDCSTLRRKRGL